MLLVRIRSVWSCLHSDTVASLIPSFPSHGQTKITEWNSRATGGGANEGLQMSLQLSRADFVSPFSTLCSTDLLGSTDRRQLAP